MALVEPPVAAHGDPRAAHRDAGRARWCGWRGSAATCAATSGATPCSAISCPALGGLRPRPSCGERRIPPAGEEVELVPLALAVAEEHEPVRHGGAPYARRWRTSAFGRCPRCRADPALRVVVVDNDAAALELWSPTSARGPRRGGHAASTATTALDLCCAPPARRRRDRPPDAARSARAGGRTAPRRRGARRPRDRVHQLPGPEPHRGRAARRATYLPKGNLRALRRAVLELTVSRSAGRSVDEAEDLVGEAVDLLLAEHAAHPDLGRLRR